MTKKIIREILKIEWEFFDSTQNLDGRASCQNNKHNFLLSRYAYLDMYDENILSSYLQDLIYAHKNDINLITQKYGYMMESTDIKNYNLIKNNLIKVTADKQKLIDEIVAIFINWSLQSQNTSNDKKNTYINRAIHSTKDMKTSTSAQTYIIGELKTYSIATLQKILDYFKTQNKLNNNPIIISNTKLQNNEYVVDFE